jgi:hypothetical protein
MKALGVRNPKQQETSMTMMMRYSAVAAGLIGGAMLAMGAVPASATSLAPTVMHTGANVDVEQVQYRSGYGFGRPTHHYGRYAPRHGGLGFHFGLTPHGPTAGFALGAPYGHRGYALAAPYGHRGFGVGGPVGQSHGFGAPAFDPFYGRIDR